MGQRTVFVVSALLLAASVQAADWQTIQSRGTLRAATEGAYAPFNFFKGGKLTGLEIEVVDAIAARLGLKTEWKTGSFDNLLIGLGQSQDRYDIVAASHSITPERAQAVDFLDPTYCSQVVLVSKAGGPKSLSALKGKRVSVQVGTVGIPVIGKVEGLGSLKTFPTDPEAMQALILGRVDTWVSETPTVTEAQKANPQAGLEMGDRIAELKIAMAVSKGNESLRNKINQALAAIRKDGTFEKIRKNYVTLDIACRN